MKYRTKILLLFVTLALATNGVLLGLMYYHAKKSLIAQMQSTVLSIGSTTAATLDVAKHQLIQSRDDESGAAYKEIEGFLRQVRDANRRNDVKVRFIYTLAPDATNSKTAHFVVDAEETGPDKSHFGDEYKTEGGEVFDLEKSQVPNQFIKDQWGTWLTALIPFKNTNGIPVGVVGVDISAEDVLQQLRLLFLSGIGAISVALALAVTFAMQASRRVSEPLAIVRGALQEIGKGNLDTHVQVKSKDEFGEVATAINDMVVGLRQRDNLKSTLVSYVSQQVADDILKVGKAELRTERIKVTVLFVDVRGFTSLSERLTPEEIVTLLNEFFGKMIEVVFRYKGSLNKFLGDGLIALFGAPVDDPEQEEHAIRAALDMQYEMEDFRVKVHQRHNSDFRIGIGIHTGAAVVGNIGTRQKMEYTAIGDTVNTASRLESATKELGMDIVVSKETLEPVKRLFRCKPMATITVKGKTHALEVYGVEGIEPAQTS